MFGKWLFVFLVFLGLGPASAIAAQAEEHVVIILEESFFPRKTVVEQGDMVRFVNESGHPSTIRHKAGKWITRPISDGEELLVTITPGMSGAFYSEADNSVVGLIEAR